MKINWEIIKGFFVTFKKPLALAIESTNECNAKCVMCFRENHTREQMKIDFGLFEKIIQDAKKNKITVFQLSFYGESLLDPFLFKKIKYISKHISVAWIQIVTNGSLLTEENSQKLLNLGISEIRVSIEGNNKDEYERIRRGLNYDLLVNNLAYLKSLRDTNKKYETQLVVTGLNLKEYPLDELVNKRSHGRTLCAKLSFFSKSSKCSSRT